MKWEELLYLIIKIYCIATVIKILCFWQRNKHMDLHNEIENPEITQCKYAQLILHKGLKMQFNKRKITFSTNGTVESGQPQLLQKDLNLKLKSYIKNNSKWSMNLNIKNKSRKC